MLVPVKLTYPSHLHLGTFIGLSLLHKQVIAQLLNFFAVQKTGKGF